MKFLSWLSGGRKPAEDHPSRLEAHVEHSVAWAEQAWQLPADYFRTWRRDMPRVVQIRDVNALSDSNSPLHYIMDGGHDDVPEQVRKELWFDLRYRRAVAHVFSLVDADEAVDWANGRLSDGYWEPMGRVVLRAAQEGLVGRPCVYDGDLRRHYPPVVSRINAALEALQSVNVD